MLLMLIGSISVYLLMSFIVIFMEVRFSVCFSKQCEIVLCLCSFLCVLMEV